MWVGDGGPSPPFSLFLGGGGSRVARLPDCPRALVQTLLEGMPSTHISCILLVASSSTSVYQVNLATLLLGDEEIPAFNSTKGERVRGRERERQRSALSFFPSFFPSFLPSFLPPPPPSSSLLLLLLLFPRLVSAAGGGEGERGHRK